MLFRLYDIRGVYPDEINFDTARLVGSALGTFLSRKLTKPADKLTVVVGRDNRESSPEISAGLTLGLLEKNLNVIDAGISLTPIIHYLTCSQDFDLGIEVTASHNPREFNGFRIDYKGAIPFYGDDIQEIKNLVEQELSANSASEIEKAKIEKIAKNISESGNFSKFSKKYEKKDLAPLYIENLKSRFSFKNAKKGQKPLKVVVDCGYGTTSYFVEKLFFDLGIDLVGVYCKPDSALPHGTPDPENPLFLQELKTKVLEHHADIGFAFDEDSDRFGVVDHNGNSYENDKLLLLFAKEILKQNPGKTIAFDVKCTVLLPKMIANLGGVPKMIKTGHPYFVEEILKGAVLAGEYSGHMYFAETGYDDGIYAACRVLELVNQKNKKLAELMTEFPKTAHTAEIKIICPDDQKSEIVEKVAKMFKSVEESGNGSFIEINRIDGIRVSTSQSGWFLIRASNTSPYLSFRAEGADSEELKLIIEGAKGLLQNFKELDLTPLTSAKPFIS